MNPKSEGVRRFDDFLAMYQFELTMKKLRMMYKSNEKMLKLVEQLELPKCGDTHHHCHGVCKYRNDICKHLDGVE